VKSEIRNLKSEGSPELEIRLAAHSRLGSGGWVASRRVGPSSFAARWSLVLLLAVVPVLSANADTWTNRAGHVLHARLVAIEGEQIVLQRATTNGRTWRLPLASLKPADQQRARAQAGVAPIPSELRACLSQAEEDIQRAAKFLQGGRITREQYAARWGSIRQRFDYFGWQVLKDRSEQSRVALLTSLRQRLDEMALSSAR
jgi:hypothetical protein